MEKDHIISSDQSEEPRAISHDPEIFEMLLRYICFTEDFET